MATDPHTLSAQARRTYERARLRGAFVLALPIVAIAGLAWLIDRQTMPIAVAGPLLFATAVVFFWRGQHLGRGVLPGIAAGAIPFVAMHVARASGHVCNGAMCFSACLPATFAGAAIAGLVSAQRARRSGAPLASWGSAGFIAVLTGALGCACIGLGGVVGLVAGLLVGSVPMVLRPAVAGGRS
ncbi:MAG: hypothetical protein NVSMB47_10080 [Polyangiales bacterium]